MKDKLTFKRKRINWKQVIHTLGLQDYVTVKDGCKVKSINKICYLFLLHEFGRKFIKTVRDDPKYFYDYDLLLMVRKFKIKNLTEEEIFRIAKTPWIKQVEE